MLVNYSELILSLIEYSIHLLRDLIMLDNGGHAHLILQFLEKCMSSDSNQREHAEAKLSNIVCIMMSGSNLSQNEVILQALLQTVAPHTDSQAASFPLPSDLRIITCIWIKNLVSKYWKAPQFVSDRWKSQVFRNALLRMAIQEPDQVVALHLRVIVAYISRCDFPSRWKMEDLFQPLVICLQMPGDISHDLADLIEKQHRAIQIILCIIKELVTRRLMVHRKQFDTFAVEILPFLLNHWDVLLHSIGDQSVLQFILKLTKTSTKLIALILTNAFRALATQQFEMVNAILGKVCQYISGLHAQFPSGHNQTAMTIEVGKCIYQMSKLLMKIQASYPMECREYLQVFLRLFWEILEANVNTDTKSGIVCVQFFTNVFNCELYKSKRGSETSKVMHKVMSANGQVELCDEMIAQAQYAISQFLDMPSHSSNACRVVALLQRVVLQLLRQSTSDLEAWSEDPESFFHISKSLTAEESIRVTAENLFLTMLQQYPTICITEFQKLIAQVPEKFQLILSTQPNSSSELSDIILELDSIFLALGLGSYILYQQIDFNRLYVAIFYPLFTTSDAYHIGSLACSGRILPVIFHRSIWLVGRWLGQLAPSHWPILYESALKNAFGNEEIASRSNSEDIVLKLQTISLIECMVADWSAEVDQLKQYLPMILHGLYSFLMTTSTLESKQMIFYTLEMIAKTLGPSIIVCLPQLCTPLTTLWSRSSDDSNLIRGKILSFLKQILISVNELLNDALNCELDAIEKSLLPLQEMCFQGVKSAMDTKATDSYLLEKGLELWYQLILSMKEYSDPLEAIFPHALDILQHNYEHGLILVKIIEKYLTLNGTERFWDIYHAPILNLCITPMINNVNSQVSIALAHLLEQTMEHLHNRGAMTPSLCNELIEPTRRLLACCVRYSENHGEREPESVIISYLHVFAFLVLFLPQFDWVYVSVLKTNSLVLDQLVDLMLSKFPNSHTQSINTNSSSVWYPCELRRKLWASALVALLVWSRPVCKDRVEKIERIANQVIKEMQSRHSEDPPDQQIRQVRGTKWKKIAQVDLRDFLDRNVQSLRNRRDT